MYIKIKNHHIRAGIYIEYTFYFSIIFRVEMYVVEPVGLVR